MELLVNQIRGSITANFDELKENVAEMMNVYKDTELTDQTIATGKADLATLRKIKTAFETKRKEVKKEWNKPYEEFEQKVKEITSLIDEPIELIDNQLKEFEQKRIVAKREEIKQIYSENIGEAADYIPLDKIYNIKWENATYKSKQIIEDITTLANTTFMAVETIKHMNSDGVEKALEMYKSDLSLTNAISYINKYEAQKAEILKREQERKEREERERKEREERIERERIQREKEEAERIEREAARKKIEEEERQKAEAQRRIDEAFMATEEQQAEPIPFTHEAEPFVQDPVPMKSSRNIKLIVTEEEFNLFRALMEEHNIEWGEN